MSINEPSHEKNNNLSFRPSRHKPVCRDTEAGQKLLLNDLRSRCIAKTKTLNSFVLSSMILRSWSVHLFSQMQTVGFVGGGGSNGKSYLIPLFVMGHRDIESVHVITGHSDAAF